MIWQWFEYPGCPFLSDFQKLCPDTVKHAYSEHAYNEFMLKVKWYSFSVCFKHIAKLMYITNFVYNEVKLPVLGSLL